MKTEDAPKPDPRRANVDFRYGEIVPGCGCIGRIYYWYEPDGVLAAVDDWDLKKQYPEIAEEEWDRLFREGFARGQAMNPTPHPWSLFDPPRPVELDNRAPGGEEER
jgi:hypothetical protein